VRVRVSVCCVSQYNLVIQASYKRTKIITISG